MPFQYLQDGQEFFKLLLNLLETKLKASELQVTLPDKYMLFAVARSKSQ